MNQYPEHEKLAVIQGKSQTIGEFLNWMPEEGYHIGVYVQDPEWLDEQFLPTNFSINELLAKYFEIDLDKIEDEKRQMLKSIRETQK